MSQALRLRHREVNPYLTSSELSVQPAQCHVSGRIIGIRRINMPSATGRKHFHVRYIR